jgi:hypothetical protein
MLAQSHARKPAPPLAARGMWLRLRLGADAFGSALGDSIVGAIADRDKRQTPAPIEDKSQRGFLKPDGTFMSNDEYKSVLARVPASGLTDSSTDAEFLAYQMKQAGYEGDLQDVGFKDIKDTIKRGLAKVGKWADDQFSSGRQATADATTSDSWVDSNGMCMVPSRHSPGANATQWDGSTGTLPQAMAAYNDSFDRRAAVSTADGLIVMSGDAAVAKGAQIAMRGVNLLRSTESLGMSELRAEFSLGLRSDLPSTTLETLSLRETGSVTSSLAAQRSVLTADEFTHLSFDVDKGKITTGAVEEIRAAQAAQAEGLLGGGAIARGERGADLNVAGTDVSIKAYRNDAFVSNSRKVGQLVGSLNADENVLLLLDARALNAKQINNITNTLTQRGVDPARIIVPSQESYGPIRVVGADGRIVEH